MKLTAVRVCARVNESCVSMCVRVCARVNESCEFVCVCACVLYIYKSGLLCSQPAYLGCSQWGECQNSVSLSIWHFVSATDVLAYNVPVTCPQSMPITNNYYE